MLNKDCSLQPAMRRIAHTRQPSSRSVRVAFYLLVVGMAALLWVTATPTDSANAAMSLQTDGTVPGTLPPGGTVPPPGTVPPRTVIYLGFKTSDEIEFDDDENGEEREDFVYKNEDIVAFDPATGEFSIFFDGSECGLDEANLDDFEFIGEGQMIFTLRSEFDIPGLGEVDDSDVISYTASADANVACGTFGIYVRGEQIGLTDSEEDIDALGLAEDGTLLVSTIGTARVPTAPGQGNDDDDDDDDGDNDVLKVSDTSLMKLNAVPPFSETTVFTWSLYFDGEDVDLTETSEDIRSVSVGGYEKSDIYLTLSGDFDVESLNEDEGDKNDVEGCVAASLGDLTECTFFKWLDGEAVGAENQLDGLAIVFGPPETPVTPINQSSEAPSAREAEVEAMADQADYAEALTEGSEASLDDFLDVAGLIYLPMVER
jgi:hypothetical protein